MSFFFFQAEDGIRDDLVTGVQTCALPIFRGEVVKLPVERFLGLLGLGVTAAIALATGASMMGEWSTLALYWHAPQAAGGVVDPIFGHSLNFFLFTLPAWQLIAGWLMTMAIGACLIAPVVMIILRPLG